LLIVILLHHGSRAAYVFPISLLLCLIVYKVQISIVIIPYVLIWFIKIVACISILLLTLDDWNLGLRMNIGIKIIHVIVGQWHSIIISCWDRWLDTIALYDSIAI
jgi:hypothetical protein